MKKDINKHVYPNTSALFGASFKHSFFIFVYIYLVGRTRRNHEVKATFSEAFKN